MLALGIESTAHTFGIGIIDDKGNVLANCKDAFASNIGGMVPAEVAEHHFDCWEKVLNGALEKAKTKLGDIDLFVFSQGPGIGHCLRVGAFIARCMALEFDKPIIGVNHCISHLSIGKLRTTAKDPVLLYASGANTQIIAFDGGKYRIFGETLDMGTGNFIDSIAREMKLGFPGGPKIEELAKKGNKLIELPYSVKGVDISFGGLFTNIVSKIKKGDCKLEDIAFSIQETVFAMLVEVTERAMAHTNKNELLLGGGVACNTRLQEMCKIMCKERNAKFFAPEKEFLVDNGVQIAWLGLIMYKKGITTLIEKTDIRPYERTDSVNV